MDRRPVIEPSFHQVRSRTLLQRGGGPLPSLVRPSISIHPSFDLCSPPLFSQFQSFHILDDEKMQAEEEEVKKGKRIERAWNAIFAWSR